MWTKGRSYVDKGVEVWTKVLNCADESADLYGQALKYVEKVLN